MTASAKPSNKAPAAALGVLAIGIATPTVMHYEGLSLTGYADPVGIPTECWGSTKHAKIGLERSLNYCRGLLERDMQEHWQGVAKCIKRDLYPHEAAAILSWAFNVGVRNACQSTLMALMNAGKPAAEWCAQLDRWVYSRGIKFSGLVKRRATERAMCEGRL